MEICDECGIILKKNGERLGFHQHGCPNEDL